MVALQRILEVLVTVSLVWLTVMMIYQLYLTVFGFKRETKDYADHDPQSRFLVLVPAHNEERVIGDIISNLQKMDYPKELYDFYIIADNCTDNTAQVARDMGAQVIVHEKETPDAPTGKPIALKMALETIGHYDEKYDMLMIFDADNLVDTNMFREVNSQFIDKGRPDLIQCYLDSKNKDGVVAWFYYTSYTMTNRFFQLAKHRLGLNCTVGGTGYAITTSYLHERGGWTTCSLTEDMEIQVAATLEGRRILWNHNTRVYDEKPTSFKASVRQKIRWAQGHWFVAIRNTGKLFRQLFDRKLSVKEFISIGTYMYSLSAYVVTLIMVVANLMLILIPELGHVAQSQSLLSQLGGMLLFIYSYLGLFYTADWLDNGIKFRWRTLPMMLAGFIASMAVSMISQLVGLIFYRRQNNWVKTEHKISGGTPVVR